ncbi:hypothetical protein EJ08DRAFT_28971 [Tothia fuscella]|uniref:Uncharacterized protein n=1 Tax=Tothia fuscella TaxID=1048955 RepID=A0A9P4NG73_9PEZI|nr:hypothetical protein EJ08DRAFT_28971 [Tothia fuscella]
MRISWTSFPEQPQLELALYTARLISGTKFYLWLLVLVSPFSTSSGQDPTATKCPRSMARYKRGRLHIEIFVVVSSLHTRQLNKAEEEIKTPTQRGKSASRVWKSTKLEQLPLNHQAAGPSTGSISGESETEVAGVQDFIKRGSRRN